REFPWDREVYALVLERLMSAGAKAVVFDMLFPNPREGDASFRAALDRYADRVVIGANLKDVKEDADLAQNTLGNKPVYIVPSRSLVPSGRRDDPAFGFVNVREEEDKIVRHLVYQTTLPKFFDIPSVNENEILPSLAARTLQKAGYADRIPRTQEPVLIRFCENIQPRSLYEIFVAHYWDDTYQHGEYFRGKIVLVGAAGDQAEDRLRTPHGTVLAPMIHLSAINAALNRDFIHETGIIGNIALIVGGGLLAWVLATFVHRPLLRLGLIVGTIAAYYGVSQVIFNDFGILPILLSPVLALTASGFTWSAWEQVLDRVERQRVRRNFERYVSKDVVGEILDNPQTYLDTLGGQRKEVTILFSDIRGFTTLTESADPHALVGQLNEYFGEMVGLVFANHGTLDKFIGDAVMAHWGSITTAGPTDDAIRAVTTALKMRESLARLNASWKERGMVEWKIGIGVNFGRPIVGNIGATGSVEKFDFTVIGDAVNLASRLEGVTKQYGIDMCIGERVAAMVGDQFLLRSVDLIIVKGKTKPVEIFTVLGPRDSTAVPPWLAKHEEAMHLYRAGEFAAAENIWRDITAEAPSDALTKVFMWRCVSLQANPPEPPWTGVYEMKSK
ncbi:MAG TPA: adenylate/guanylate cyclase domain-containing protein, partial [Chthoniobacter sp.]|nr:adenylate/guanylate cyclase domain-containing protein [Chthoniobacter sp.]